jgi:hypothetical protein
VVRARFADGGTDEMRPVDGWSVVARHSPVASAEVDAVDEQGRVVARKPVQFPSPFGVASLPPLFVRTTSDGVTVVGRLRRGFFAPAVWNEGAADALEGIALCRPAPPDALIADYTLVQGVGEGMPFTVLPVHTGLAVARVRARFADGVTDEMAPIEGQALLARQGDVGRATVEALDRSGRVVARRQVAAFAGPVTECGRG